MFPQSPTYQSSSHYSKNSRLYHQLLQGTYLSDHIYNPSTNKSSSAAIKFVASLALPNQQASLGELHQKEDSLMRSPRYNSVFKSSEGTKNSRQMTLSFPSNYSIIEIENQSHSTINIYNLSRNNIEDELSISSNNITAKLHHQNSHIVIPDQSKHSENLLQKAVNNQLPKVQQRSALKSKEQVRLYINDEYSEWNKKGSIIQQGDEEIDSPLPKLLSNKYINNSLNRKFSSQNKNQVETEKFKAVLNQIHAVPYKNNQEAQPHVFSFPADDKKENEIENKQKMNIVNKQNSRQGIQREEKANKISHFSNYAQHNNMQSVRLHNHIPIADVTVKNNKEMRQMPKSEAKVYHASNQKTTRSNSFGSKAKPCISLTQSQRFQIKPQTKLLSSFNDNGYKDEQQLKPNNITVQDNSVIYEQSQVNLCCSFSQQQRTNANRIIFKQKNQSSAVNFYNQMESIDSTNLNRSKRVNPCTINPVRMIKSYNENRESESQKKGIKLVGFNSSFPKKSED